MLLLHSGCVQHLFMNTSPFEVPHATLPLIHFYPLPAFYHCSCMTMSLMPCHSCTVSNPSAGDNQPLPGLTTALGPFLQLSTALWLDTSPHTASSVLCNLFFRNFLLLSCSLFFLGICLLIRGLHFYQANPVVFLL
jgi:hypothetical protein